MTNVTTIGLDIGKRVLQVHGADASGRPVLQRKLRREEVLPFFASLPRCLVGLEAWPSRDSLAALEAFRSAFTLPARA